MNHPYGKTRTRVKLYWHDTNLLGSAQSHDDFNARQGHLIRQFHGVHESGEIIHLIFRNISNFTRIFKIEMVVVGNIGIKITALGIYRHLTQQS